MGKRTSNKRLVIVLSLILIVGLCLCGYGYQKLTEPIVYIDKSIPSGAADDHYFSKILIAIADDDGRVKSQKVEQQLKELTDWNRTTHDYILGYVQNEGHYHIDVSGEVQSGKTTLRYEGYVTDENGNRMDIFEEKTFDFVLDKDLFDGE